MTIFKGLHYMMFLIIIIVLTVQAASNDDTLLTVAQYCKLNNFDQCDSCIKDYFYPPPVNQISVCHKRYLAYRENQIAKIINKNVDFVKDPNEIKLVLAQVAPKKMSPNMARIYRVSSQALSVYSSLHDVDYLSYRGHVGPKSRSVAYSRVHLLKWLLKSDYDWVLYLDSDAFIVNKDFNISSFISRYHDKALLLCRGGDAGEIDQDWDINNGVFFANLKHKVTVSLIETLLDYLIPFERDSDVSDGNSNDWGGKKPWEIDFLNIQEIFHRLLRYDSMPNGTVPYVKVFRGEEHNIFNYHGPNLVHAVGFRTFKERIDFMLEKAQGFLRSIGN